MYGGGEQTVSEPWRKSLDLGTTVDPNISSAMDDDEHFCKLVLYKEIQDSRVRIWDIVILIPNLLFLLFIVVRFNRARLKLRATSSPIYLAFYGLVICNVIISVIRCVVSMTVNAAANVGGKADKVLWVTVRFFLLSTEMSVVIFGLAFGHLDSRSSIRRVLLATSFIALAFTITQGTLELVLPDDTFHIPSRDFYVFGHGGMMFWFCSSLVFTVIYIFILILPRTRLRDRLNLPTRKSFYIYAGTLATLNLVQSIGAGLLNYTQNPAGLCVVDFTAAMYLTLFTPLVYHTFLSDVFGVSQPSIMFSYKAQVDDTMEEDTVSLPHQQSFSSLKTDNDYIYQVHTPSIHMPLYESLTVKPSVSKQKTSLHSLSSKKDPNTPGTSHDISQQTYIYNASMKVKNIVRLRNVQKSTINLVGHIANEPADFIGSQNTEPDELSFNNSYAINSNVISNPKFRASDSVTNLVMSSTTANNFIYRPKNNDSNVNSFAESRRLNQDIGTQCISSLNSGIMPDIDENQSIKSHMTMRPELDLRNPSASVSPPLERSLQNILDSNIDESSVQLSTMNFTSNQSIKLHNLGVNDDKYDTNDVITEKFKKNFAVHKRNCSASGEKSHGLGDYLQSLKSFKY
ncbi:hypothetical protein PV327_007316 [Microctonus hyperodae]|uniref:Transmembrane protein adipocyte-associated 1 homolog n=1 Tax=Microctonus hyperodae TaxID=165561 RepID=A0AA39F673_MICHY|nr:hypothetical protein PV327_007316 [Microctonus hyperodae]